MDHSCKKKSKGRPSRKRKARKGTPSKQVSPIEAFAEDSRRAAQRAQEIAKAAREAEHAGEQERHNEMMETIKWLGILRRGGFDKEEYERMQKMSLDERAEYARWRKEEAEAAKWAWSPFL